MAYVPKRRTYSELEWFRMNYDEKAAKTLSSLWIMKHTGLRGSSVFPDGVPFDENWKKDHKRFARYVSQLENFDRWPEYQFNRIDNEQGYLEGNVNFVTPLENTRNRAGLRKVQFGGNEYFMSEFVELITGTPSCVSVYKFVTYRLGKRPIKEILRELLANIRVWPTLEIKMYFKTWYKQNMQ